MHNAGILRSKVTKMQSPTTPKPTIEDRLDAIEEKLDALTSDK